MSDTTTTTPTKPPAQPSGAGSLTVAAAAITLANWVLSRYQIEMPADVGMAAGVLLTAGAHGLQMLFLAWHNR